MDLTNDMITEMETMYPHLKRDCDKVRNAKGPIRGVLEKTLCMTYLNIEARGLGTDEIFNLAKCLTRVNEVKAG